MQRNVSASLLTAAGAGILFLKSGDFLRWNYIVLRYIMETGHIRAPVRPLLFDRLWSLC